MDDPGDPVSRLALPFHSRVWLKLGLVLPALLDLFCLLVDVMLLLLLHQMHVLLLLLLLPLLLWW